MKGEGGQPPKSEKIPNTNKHLIGMPAAKLEPHTGGYAATAHNWGGALGG